MCECRKIKSFFACPDDFNNLFSFNFDVVENFPKYFREDAPTDEVIPKFDYSITSYRCLECQQWWYFECSPTESPYPMLGIKLKAQEHSLSKAEVKAIKQFLIILAHEGFSAEECVHYGCSNLALKNIKICVNHFL